MNAPLIALVEDNADDEALTMRALKKHGIANDIVVLRDGVEALAFLLAPDKPLPQLVLLDLNLPRPDLLDPIPEVQEPEELAGRHDRKSDLVVPEILHHPR
jgi:CheY-like chemotaxis protein